MTDESDEHTDIFDSPERDDTEYQISDPEQLHKVRRLEQIHSAREQYSDLRLRAVEKESTTSRHDKDTTRRLLGQAAVEYLRQLEPIIRQSESDLLERTITTTEQEVSLADLLDNNGEIEKTVKREQSTGLVNHTLMATATATGSLRESESLRVVRLCDNFLDNHIPFDLHSDSDPLQL